MHLLKKRCNEAGITTSKEDVIDIDENNSNSGRSLVDKQRRVRMTQTKALTKQKFGEGGKPSARSVFETI